MFASHISCVKLTLFNNKNKQSKAAPKLTSHLKAHEVLVCDEQRTFFHFSCLCRWNCPSRQTNGRLANCNYAYTILKNVWCRFMTLFSYSFPMPCVLRIFDAFLSEGLPILFRVALGTKTASFASQTHCLDAIDLLFSPELAAVALFQDALLECKSFEVLICGLIKWICVC